MKVKLNNVRLAFPALWTPTAFAPGDPLKYKAIFIIDKKSEAYKQLVKTIKDVMKEKWGKVLRVETCLRDSDEKEYAGFDEGTMFCSAAAKKAPLVLSRRRQPVLESDENAPYAGCYVNAIIDVYAQDTPSRRVNAALNGVQFYKDGEAFAGGAPTTVDDFDEYEDEDDEYEDEDDEYEDEDEDEDLPY